MGTVLVAAASSGRPITPRLVKTVRLSFLVTILSVIPLFATWLYHMRGIFRVISGTSDFDQYTLRSELGSLLVSPVVLIAGPIGAISSAVFCVSFAWLVGLWIGRTFRPTSSPHA